MRSVEPSAADRSPALCDPSALMRGVGHEDAHINPDPEVVSPIDKRDAKNPATFG
jgi:hypothetical protein